MCYPLNYPDERIRVLYMITFRLKLCHLWSEDMNSTNIHCQVNHRSNCKSGKRVYHLHQINFLAE